MCLDRILETGTQLGFDYRGALIFFGGQGRIPVLTDVDLAILIGQTVTGTEAIDSLKEGLGQNRILIA